MKFFSALILTLILLNARSQVVTPAFDAPDTICIDKQPFSVTNLSAGATNYYWSFCSANLNNANVQVENLGNISGLFNQPVFMDYVFVNGNYYGFLTNYAGGNLIRLDFGNSLLNTPVAVNLGNFSGLLPSNVGTEGIQVVQNEGKWYAIIVAGYTPSGSTPKIIKIEFGTDITNPTPTATDWGNIGNLYQPIDLHLFRENNNWYGFTVNAENNTITRFYFGSSFDNPPTAVNLGNLGNLAYPTGLYAINDGGNWMLFITNAGDNTRTGGVSSITRLDFGSSLLNTPTATNLGNLNNTLRHPRDLTILRSCDQIVGYVVNGNPGAANIVKIDFNNNLTSVPSGVSLTNSGFAFPHSISKLFRVNETVYGFITDAQNNTLSRLKVPGCNNSSIPSSTDKDPPPISYDQPGVYNINLTVDIGLPTQSSFCKQVVVVTCPDSVIRNNDTTLCAGSQVQIKTRPADSYIWTPATYLDDPTSGSPIASPPQSITYYVEAYIASTNTTILDSIHIIVEKPLIKANKDTTICAGSPVQMNATGATSYNWLPQQALSNPNIPNPVATPLSTTQYIVTGFNNNGCAASDTVMITVLPKPALTISNDTLICRGVPVQLNAGGATSYVWSPPSTLNDYLIPDPVAITNTSTMYKVKGTSTNGCTSEDSVNIQVRPYPQFTTSGNKTVCEGDQLMLTASGGTSYEWTPASAVTDPYAASTLVTASGSNTVYTVHIMEDVCNNDTTMNVNVAVNQKPNITIAKSNDINCERPTAQLIASGADSYFWTPFANLDDGTSSKPIVAVDTTTTFSVTGYTDEGCTDTASVTVKVDRSGVPRFVVPNAFTPNGDGKNDCFGIRHWGSAQVQQFTIYNRWGQIVFQAKNPAQCWDGRFKGVLQDGGGYVYIIDAVTFCGRMQRKGMLFLIR
jgi:gliding motility-associated-like protein